MQEKSSRVTSPHIRQNLHTALHQSSKCSPFGWSSLSSSPASAKNSMLALSDRQPAFESESHCIESRPILIIWSDYWFNLLKSIHTLYLPHKKPCFISAGEQRTSGRRSKSNNSPDPNSTNPPIAYSWNDNDRYNAHPAFSFEIVIYLIFEWQLCFVSVNIQPNPNEDWSTCSSWNNKNLQR